MAERSSNRENREGVKERQGSSGGPMMHFQGYCQQVGTALAISSTMVGVLIGETLANVLNQDFPLESH